MPSALRARAASPNSLNNHSQLNESAAVPTKIRLKSYDAISSPVVRRMIRGDFFRRALRCGRKGTRGCSSPQCSSAHLSVDRAIQDAGHLRDVHAVVACVIWRPPRFDKVCRLLLAPVHSFRDRAHRLVLSQLLCAPAATLAHLGPLLFAVDVLRVEPQDKLGIELGRPACRGIRAGMNDSTALA